MLCALPMAAWLSALAVAGNAVSAAGIRVLASSSWPRLAVLDLSSNPIGNDGIRVLAAAPALTALTELSLNSCGVGGPGLQALAGSSAFPRLRRLDLDGGTAEEVTNDDAAALAGSDRLSGLTRLSLRGRRMSDDARTVLHERFGHRLILDGWTAEAHA